MLYSNPFIEKLKAWPSDKILLVENNSPITAGELWNHSISMAHKLLSKGIKKGDRVVMVLKPGSDFLKLMYANMLVRSVITIIDPEMGRDNYKAKFKQFNPQHAFVDSRLILLNEHPILRYILGKIKPSLPFFPRTKHCSIFTIGKRLPIFQKHIYLSFQGLKPFYNEIHNADSNEDDFLVTYTSGTLAEPKGVVHTIKSLDQTMSLLTDLLDKGSNENIATHLPHFMLLGISAGRRVYMWDNEISAQEKLQFIEEKKISTIFGPPSDFVPMMQYLTKSPAFFPSNLKNIYFGSAPVHAAFLSKFAKVCSQVKLTCLYGMTENLMVCVKDGHEKATYQGKGDILGKPFAGVQLTIENDGEIGVYSNQKFKRYWHEETSSDVHLSGDLGEIDSDGNLILIGRKKDMIIRGNFNLYPGLYEPTINKIPGILEAVFIGVFGEKLTDEVVYLVIETEQQISKKIVMQRLESGPYSIDKEALPDEIRFQKLPRLGRQNKVDRNKMRFQFEKEEGS